MFNKLLNFDLSYMKISYNDNHLQNGIWYNYVNFPDIVNVNNFMSIYNVKSTLLISTIIWTYNFYIPLPIKNFLLHTTLHTYHINICCFQSIYLILQMKNEWISKWVLKITYSCLWSMNMNLTFFEHFFFFYLLFGK